MKINGKQTDIQPGETIMQLADRLGIDIPRMCHRDNLPHFTSCMVCQVKDNVTGRLLPSCSIPAHPDMEIDTESDDVKLARKVALELLLSEHVGDCEAPCTAFCPAGMDIPQMIRQIAAGDYLAALKTVKRDLTLPAVLGRICSAPCESGCRRKYHDEAISICKLHQFVADMDLAEGSPWLPEKAEPTGKSVAIIGAGPMGLAASWQLAQMGYAVSLFDDHGKAGGTLRYEVPNDILDPAVLDKEIEAVMSLGITFRPNTRVGEDISLKQFAEQHDAVLIAFALATAEDASKLGFPGQMDKKSYMTSLAGVFCRPGIATGSKMMVRAEAAGKDAAHIIHSFLSTGKAGSANGRFNSMIGKPLDGEMPAFLGTASMEARADVANGFSAKQAQSESARCLHCDCRRKDNCELRDHSTEVGAKQKEFTAETRIMFTQKRPAENVVLETGKCISCGICVRICERDKVSNGFTFLNRGYDIRVGTPFDQTIDAKYTDTINECVRSCPTGALSFIGPTDTL